MRKVEVFTDWLWEDDCPPDILDIALKFAKAGTYYSGQHNYTSYPEQFFADGFDPVREWVDSKLEEVRRELDWEFDELKSTVYWTTMSEKGQWHHAHCHGLSMVSGILYLTQSGSETWFSREGIWGPEHTLFPLHKTADPFTLFHKRKTEVGKLILFPSRLLHSVTEHDLDDPRHSLSFNAFPSGQIGSYSDKHSRRLLNITVNQKQ